AAPANLVESWRYRRAAAARRAAVASLREVSISAARTLISEACERAERAIRAGAAHSAGGSQVAELVTAEQAATARTERLDVLFSEWDEVVAEQIGRAPCRGS